MIDYALGRARVPKQYMRMDYYPDSMYIFTSRDATFYRKTMESLLLNNYIHLVNILENTERIDYRYRKQFRSKQEYIHNLLIVVSDRRSNTVSTNRLSEMHKHLAWILLKAEDLAIYGPCDICHIDMLHLTKLCLYGGNEGFSMKPCCENCTKMVRNSLEDKIPDIRPFRFSTIYSFQDYQGAVTEQRQYIRLLKKYLFHRKRVTQDIIFNLLISS